MFLFLIIAGHVIFPLAWVWPLRMITGWRHGPALCALAYLVSGTLTIMLAYGLDAWHRYDPLVFWVFWVLFLCGACFYGRLYRRPKRRVLRLRRAEAWCLVLGLPLAFVTRLSDPLNHPSLASTDVYVFLNTMWRMAHDHIMILSYPAGLSVLIERYRLGVDVMQAMRFAPQVIASLTILSCLGFLGRVWGCSAAILTGLTLSGSVLIYPILVQHTLYPQMTTLGLCLPALLFAVPSLLARPSPGRGTWLTAVTAMTFLVLTSTVYGLYLTVLTGLWSAWYLLRRRIVSVSFWSRVALVLAPLPLFVAFYYGFALPARMPDIGLDTAEQSRRILEITQAEATSGAVPKSVNLYDRIKHWDFLPAVVRTGLIFFAPDRFEPWRDVALENVFILAAWIAAIALWRDNQSCRAHHNSFLSFLIMASIMSSITGMFELPGYRGRALYMLVFLVIIGWSYLLLGRGYSLWMANRYYSRRLARQRFVFRIACWGIAVASCFPVLYHPPIVGVSIFPLGCIMRLVPEDDLLTRTLSDPGKNRKDDLMIMLWGEETKTVNAVISSRGLGEHIARFSTTNITSAALSRVVQENPHKSIYVAASPEELSKLDYQAQIESSRLIRQGAILMQTPRYEVRKIAVSVHSASP